MTVNNELIKIASDMKLFFSKARLPQVKATLKIVGCLLLFAPQLCPAAETAKSYQAVDLLLNQVKKNSRQLRISESKAKADLVLENKESLVFETNSYIEGNYIDQDSPPTSPFSAINNKTQEYEAGVQKLWPIGIQSDLTYSLSNVKTSFQNGTSTDFLNPRLELSLSTNLFQDIVYNRYDHLNKEITSNKESIEINRKVAQKKVLANSLIAFTSILENKSEYELQEKLCRLIQKQADQLERKKRRNSASNRDYFLSIRELTNCQIRIEELKIAKLKEKNNFESTYGVTLEKLKAISAKEVFAELQEAYDKLKSNAAKEISVVDKDELKYLESLLQSAQYKRDKLKALSQPDIALQFKVGSSGLDDSFGDANQDIVDLEYPSLSVGLKTSFPWKNREVKNQVLENFHRTRVIQEQIVLTRSQAVERFSTLTQTLSQDFEIYKKYLKSLDLSEKIVKEARNDFNNGRIDFFTLTEFNKGLTANQKSLSTFRIQLAFKIIEYFDYHHYFDKFL